MPAVAQTRSGEFTRTFKIDRAAINEDKRTVEVAFSSETPVERFYGVEILDHSPGSGDITRLNNNGPFLKDHDISNQIGVIESARIDADRTGRAILASWVC